MDSPFHRFGRGFGIVGKLYGDESVINVRNPYYGIFFYVIVIILSECNNILKQLSGIINNLLTGFIDYSIVSRLLMLVTCASNLLSIYLAYLLIFVIKSICVVCVSLYCINFIISILCIRKHDNLMERINDDKFKNKKE